jgi:hypothetical protein
MVGGNAGTLDGLGLESHNDDNNSEQANNMASKIVDLTCHVVRNG